MVMHLIFVGMAVESSPKLQLFTVLTQTTGASKWSSGPLIFLCMVLYLPVIAGLYGYTVSGRS